MSRFPDWTVLDAAQRRTRAHRLNAAVNAFLSIEPARSGHGLPYAAKDMFRTPAHAPTGGLARPGDLGIAGDSDLMQRLDAAGADFIGFTGMTELAYQPSGDNAAHGRVKNPWSFDVVSGGSSSGSAAAVASGAVVAALGSDTGGSLRIPAHCCGVTAWKPTYGAVSTQGAMPLAPRLDTIGLLGRGAAELAQLAPLLGDLSSPSGITNAVVFQDTVADSDPAIRRACAQAVAAIAACGVGITQRDALPAIAAIDRDVLFVMQAESARVHRERIDDPAVSPVTRRRLAKGLEISDATLAASVAAQPRHLRDFETDIMQAADIAILPVMAVCTPAIAECDPGSDRFAPKTLYALSRFTRFVNLLGLPAVAMPAGFDDRGLPVAIQLIGRAGSDLALLELVRHVQTITDWHGRIPSAIAGLVAEPEQTS